MQGEYDAFTATSSLSEDTILISGGIQKSKNVVSKLEDGPGAEETNLNSWSYLRNTKMLGNKQIAIMESETER